MAMAYAIVNNDYVEAIVLVGEKRAEALKEELAHKEYLKTKQAAPQLFTTEKEYRAYRYWRVVTIPIME